MTNYKFTSEQIRTMKHCIGFDRSIVRGTKYRKMEAYRNRYVTSRPEEDLENLVKQGLMSKRQAPFDDQIFYFVTEEEGFKFLSELTGITITEMR